jgi:thiamine biosynthesis lipoprotein
MVATPRSTRREFLQGQAAVDALAQFDVGAADRKALEEPAADGYLLRLSRRAMACTFEIFINAGQYEHGTDVALAALDLVDRLEDQLSIYRDHSEVSRLNRQAGTGPVSVEPQLFELLVRAVELHRQTGGAFDVTAGRLSSVWGFTSRRGKIPDANDLEAARNCVGSQHLELDPTSCRVRFRRPGLEINTGSIGKGYALDRCAQFLAAEGIDDVLLHGGSSSVLARGTRGLLAGEPGWLVGVRNPMHPARRVGTLRLTDRALATSGSGTQFFVHQGRRYGHILDPRSGWPSEGVLTVSVLAPTAAEADALATAFYVMGSQAANEYCQNHPEVAAVMLCPGPREGSFETHLFGLDQHEWSVHDED